MCPKQAGHRRRAATAEDGSRPTLESALAVAIVEHADDAIIAKMLDGTIITWNPGAERVFGYAAAEMIGKLITKLFPADKLHEERELIAQLMLGHDISHFVTRRIRKDGKPLDVSVTLSPVRDPHGRVVAISTITRDVTATHQRQLAAAQAAAIVEHSDDAIIAESTDGTVITWNHGAELMFGYTPEEMTGWPITRLFPSDRLHEETDLIAKLQLGERISHFETRRVRKDGTVIDVSVTLSPVRDATGRIIAVSKIARDITERRQTRALRDSNQQLKRSNRDLEEFAFIASHDLKTPLSGIKYVATWLEEDLQDTLSDESSQMLSLIKSRIDRMETLLDDLLAYSRVGHTDTVVGETRVTDIVDRIIEVLNPPAHIRIRVEGELPVIVTAGVQLEQVLRNLVDNAVKHHDKPRGEVVLAATRVGQFVQFAVRDDGPGIPPQFHDKIFQLFQTLKRRDETEGTGLGLAIVKKLVERQHCHITVHSGGDGTGTEFRFQWPAYPSAIESRDTTHD